jgi:DivIVA domain-containing protein
MRGYDIDQVDLWLELLAKWSEGAGTDDGLGDPIRPPTFPLSFHGYNAKQVDTFISNAIRELSNTAVGTTSSTSSTTLSSAPDESGLPQRLRAAQFGLSKRGYDVDQVDDWLELLAKRCEGSGTDDGLKDPIRTPGFRVSLRGYDTKQVDALVAKAITELGTNSG